MGISIRIPGASFSKFVDREAPHIELASGFWLFGGSKEASQVNLAPNAPAGAPSWVGSGTPVFGDGYAEMSPGGAASATLDTGIISAGPDDFTFISVATPSAAGNEMLAGTWHSGINAAMLYRAASGLAVATTGSASASTLQPSSAAPSFMAAVRSGATRSAHLHNGTELQSQSFAASGSITTENTYRVGPIGGNGNMSSTARSRHAASMLFPMALTGTQLQDIYSYLKWKLGTRGVSVV